MEKAMDLYFVEKVDLIIIEFLSWSEDFAWIRFLRDMPGVPMIFVNPMKGKMTFENSLDEDDFIDFLCSGTLVGSLEASGSIPRIGRKDIKIVTGSRAEIQEEIIVFSSAARVRSILRQSVFGLLANYNDLMWSTYIDPYNLFTRVGPEMKFISYSMLADEIGKVTDAETKVYKEELLSIYKMDDDVDDDKFSASARASLGLARIIEYNDIDGMVFNDLHPTLFELVGLRPGFYHPSINSNLSVLVPEADTGACIITYIMKLLAVSMSTLLNLFMLRQTTILLQPGMQVPMTTMIQHIQIMSVSQGMSGLPKPITNTQEHHLPGTGSRKEGKPWRIFQKITELINWFVRRSMQFRENTYLPAILMGS